MTDRPVDPDPLDNATQLLETAHLLIGRAKLAAEDGPTENFDRWASCSDALGATGSALYSLQREREDRHG